MENEIMLKVSDVTKKYRLGQIGGGTLKGDLQSFMARVRHKEDPNLKIGENTGNKGDEFYALNGISFEVKKGEAIGIIGHNGAGKSTLLKLISRVTAPTSGSIGMNGRIASMLEVGTGFHPELTGRENVYMNGAILGMTKAEIDAKMEEIIDFSEVRQFIDTPVKRYSSGMYVKLAFSVASHLDSEIMIMDEVLAVGDTKFQRKCIQRMREVANSGRTILYVSHNMSTIRQLCDRCIVLSHGKVIFDGNVEEAIEQYNGCDESANGELQGYFDFSNQYDKIDGTVSVFIKDCRILGSKPPIYNDGERLQFEINMSCYENIEQVTFYTQIRTKEGVLIANAFSEPFAIKKGAELSKKFSVDIDSLSDGNYTFSLLLIETDGRGDLVRLTRQEDKIPFRKENMKYNLLTWNAGKWGNIVLPTITEIQ